MVVEGVYSAKAAIKLAEKYISKTINNNTPYS